MAFQVIREDGRPNSQVLLDFVYGKEPGTVFSYQELIDVLSKDTDRQYGKKDIQTIVVHTCPRMLKEQARTLHNVRNTGYRIAPAAYHMTLASHRKEKADTQLLRGVQVLQNVRWEEMEPNQRLAHEGQLLILGAMYQQTKALERRQRKVEDLINRMRESVTPT